MNNIFSVDANATLILENLNVTTVQIEEGSQNQVQVQIEGDENKDISVTKENGTITIKGSQKLSNSNTMVINGNSVMMTGNGMTIVNGVIFGGRVSGRVIVNGVDVTSQANNSPLPPEISIKVFVPTGTDLEVEDSNVTARSTFKLGSVQINNSGQCEVRLGKVAEIDVHCSGQCVTVVTVDSGKVKVDLSGQSKFQASGVFTSVTADVSGQSSSNTSGRVKNDYRANASGQSSINHNGEVLGRVREKSSGQSSVNIN